VDLLSGEAPARVEDQLMIPAHGCYWLTDR